MWCGVRVCVCLCVCVSMGVCVGVCGSFMDSGVSDRLQCLTGFHEPLSPPYRSYHTSFRNV